MWPRVERGEGAGSRRLTLATAAAFAAVGAVLFAAPTWSAEAFAFRISPFQAMTMGGWYLGSAVMALLAARTWRLAETFPTLVYVWAFGLSQGGLLLLHRDDVDLTSGLSVAYAAVLALASLCAVVGIADLVRRRPRVVPAGPPNPWLSRLASLLFVIYVGGIVALLVDGIEPDGRIWPGPLTLLAARAFAAFFGSLVLAEAVQLLARGFAPVALFLRGGIVLILPITAAALRFQDRFDYGRHAGGALYLGSYLAALAGSIVILAVAPRLSRPATASGSAVPGPAAPSRPAR